MSQVIAWSGAGVDVYPAILPNGSRMYTPGHPAVELLEITPEAPILFSRVIAADNTSMVMNYSSWVPQVGHHHVDPAALLPCMVCGICTIFCVQLHVCGLFVPKAICHCARP